jgi:hypothetical protein
MATTPNRRREPEGAREREAAELALQQLAWVIRYLDKIHKPAIARALDRNRRAILRQAGLD